MSRRNLVRVLAVFVAAALGLIAAPVSNAAAALLTGTISDAGGSPVPGVVVAISGEGGAQEAETNSEGFYSLEAAPGRYGVDLEGHGKGLPSTWTLETGGIELETDRKLNFTLPRTSTLTVEVLGAHGATVPGATVTIPTYLSEEEFSGEFGTSRFRGSSSPAVTGEDGRAAFIVFDGSPDKIGRRPVIAPGKVEPPSGSGLPLVEFAPPTVSEDKTSVVTLAREELKEKEAPKEEETGPELRKLFFDPPEVDTSKEGATVTVSASLEDAVGRIEKAYVVLVHPGGEKDVFSFLEQVSGTESAGVWEGNAFFPLEGEAGIWFATLHLADSTGHEVEIGPEKLQERGLIDGVQVAKFEPRVPVVTGLSVNSGPEAGGTEVVISGSNFGAATSVHFGEKPAGFTVNSAETIVAFAPHGTGTVDVTVTSPAGTSAASEADHFTYIAPPPTPAVTLTSSSNPSVHGQKVTFTATVTPPEGETTTPTGTVSFVEGATTLDVASLSSKGVAKFSTTALAAGKRRIFAEYSGDSHYSAANSKLLNQSVTAATTEVTLSSSLNPAAFGSSGTLKAHVAAVAPGAGTPTGTVTFLEGETILETVPMSGANATLKLKTLAPGTHEITAAYSGDANDKPSEGGPLTQVITPAKTQLSLTSTLNPAAFGSSGTLKATVSVEAPGGGTPTGTVEFREGLTVFGVVPLVGGSAKLPLKSIPPGTHKIIARYDGDADYVASSATVTQVIVPASTELTLTSSKNPAAQGSGGMLKATVRALAPGGGTPSGGVIFREGETVLGFIPLSGSSASFPLKALPAGEHEITATFSRTTEYEASSATIVQVITP